MKVDPGPGGGPGGGFDGPAPAPPKSERFPPYYFTVDDTLLYNAFHHDFGPLHIGHLYRFAVLLHEVLGDPENEHRPVVFWTNADSRSMLTFAALQTNSLIPFQVAYRSGGSDNSSSSEDELEVHHHIRSASLNSNASGASRSTLTPQRSHRFTAPRPMNGEVLAAQATSSSFPAPPAATESTTSSPPMSNYVSYASSARSAASSYTAPSSKSSTPAASINDESKRPSSALEIRAEPKKAKKNRWSFMLSRRSSTVIAA